MKTKQNKKSHILLAAIFAVMLFIGQGFVLSDNAYADAEQDAVNFCAKHTDFDTANMCQKGYLASAGDKDTVCTTFNGTPSQSVKQALTAACGEGFQANPTNAGGGGGGGSGGGGSGGTGKSCGGVEVAYFECGDEFTGEGGVEKSGLWGILTVVLNIMIAGVGILAVGGIVYGAIMYASAQDNASQTQEAIGIIRNTIIGLVLFAFMYALLQFLIPGGIL